MLFSNPDEGASLGSSKFVYLLDPLGGGVLEVADYGSVFLPSARSNEPYINCCFRLLGIYGLLPLSQGYVARPALKAC